MKVFDKLIYNSLISESNEVVRMLPELGSTEYGDYLESLIDELSTFKKGLRKGPDRYKHRKEISNLQRAIESLRYFNRKNKRILDS